MADSGDGRKCPKNMQGLLKFCIENTKSEDASGNSSSFSEMSDERRKWIQAAMEEMSANDPVKMMMQHLKTLGEGGEISYKEEVLEDLKEYCEDIDLARSFHQIGGFSYMTQFLKGDHAGLKWRASDLVATTVQNHPHCQQVAIDLHYVPLLLQILDRDADDMVRVKTLYAISCLTRDVPAAQEVFLDNDGLSVLTRAMQSNVEKLQIKAAFMLTGLCQSQPKFKDILCDMGMVDQLVGMLQTEHNAFHEHLMSALLALVHDHPRSKTECKKSHLQLQSTLNSRIQYLKSKEEHLEEYNYCKELLNICFPNSQNCVER